MVACGKPSGAQALPNSEKSLVDLPGATSGPVRYYRGQLHARITLGCPASHYSGIVGVAAADLSSRASVGSVKIGISVVRNPTVFRRTSMWFPVSPLGV